VSHAVRAGQVTVRRSTRAGVGVGGVALSHVLPRAVGGGIKDGNKNYPPSRHVTALLPPPPPPARAERRTVTWPALTACETYKVWGRGFRPRFGRY
jgi:hypothetical protein